MSGQLLHIHVLWLATDCFTLQCPTIGQSPVIIRAAQCSNDCFSQTADTSLSLPHTCAGVTTAVTTLQWSVWEQWPQVRVHCTINHQTYICLNPNMFQPAATSKFCIVSGYLLIKSSAGVAEEEIGGECSDTNTARHPDSHRPGQKIHCAVDWQKGEVSRVSRLARRASMRFNKHKDKSPWAPRRCHIQLPGLGSMI